MARAGPGAPCQTPAADAGPSIAWIQSVATDREAARELERFVIDASLLLEGERQTRERLFLIHQAACWLTRSALGEGERDLKDADCLDIAAGAARLFPDGQTRAELLAEVALERAERHRDAGALALAAGELADALALDPAPRLYAANLWTESAELHRFEGRWDPAEDALARALPALSWLSGSERATVGLHRELVLGRLWLDLGCLDAAWSAHERARDHAREVDPGRRKDQQLEEAVFLLESDDAHAAEALLDDLLRDPELASELRGPALLRRGIARFAAARERGALDPRAEDDLRRAAESALDPHDRLEARLRLAEIALLRGDLSATRALLDELAPSFSAAADRNAPVSPVDRALSCTLESRLARAAGASKDVLAAHRETLDAVQEELLRRWRLKKLVPGGVGFLHFGQNVDALGELCALELLLDETRGAERALARLLEAQELGSTARRMGSGGVTVADVQAGLPAGGLLLAYLYCRDRSMLFVVDARTVQARALESLDTLRPSLAEFGAYFSTPVESLPPGLRDARRAAAERLARELLERLLPDEVLERVLAAQHVTVAGEDLLECFPFEALRLGDGTWLGERVALDHWPSLPMGALVARRAARKSFPRVVAFAAPGHAPELGAPFTLTADERSALAQAWKGLELATGADATESALRASDLAAARALLLVVHGAFEAERALPAGLVLAPSQDQDGKVWCEDVQALHAPELVVLGVCGAGRGQQRRGEDGSVHLGGAWLAAGARCVIQSPFPLERSATVALVAELGRELQGGASVAEALRAARAKTARGGPVLDALLLQAIGDGR